MTKKLKCCPICGGAAEIVFKDVSFYSCGYVHYVNCAIGNCVITKGFDSEKEAIDVWNTRASDATNKDVMGEWEHGYLTAANKVLNYISCLRDFDYSVDKKFMHLLGSQLQSMIDFVKEK